MYEFPPQTWYMQGWWPMLWHCALLVAGLWLMSRHASKKRIPLPYDAGKIAVVAAMTTSLFLGPLGSEPWETHRPAPAIFFLVIWVAAAVATIRSWYLLTQKDSDIQVWLSLGIVVIAPLFVFMCLLPPYFIPTAREEARRTQCKGHLKQIGLALHNYHDVYSMFPLHRAGNPAYSWRVATLPFFDESELFDNDNFGEEWNQGSNITVAKTKLFFYECPSVPTASQGDVYPRTDYFAVTGEETAWPDSGASQLSDFSDGSSNTLLVVEACGTEIPWCEPRDLELTNETLGINLPGPEPNSSSGVISSYHREVANVLFADGAVRSLSERTEPAVLKAMLTRSGDDDPGEF
ncbi:hypothetical protein KOR42_04340 [Thalassoglobus neptunius]|uniref:DUF1559 domain-containing protein n=1 Tax=Thalassoglobus neptunius TaxID=1938619 RepID=A0A5C5X2B8_9PLAN|nr:DUF1559 domain-containing protein [Thalassoglobus neptunius]TWT57076.1 hypothetical protein KOR42_04340 [Thalassoglobus neptunius]